MGRVVETDYPNRRANMRRRSPFKRSSLTFTLSLAEDIHALNLRTAVEGFLREHLQDYAPYGVLKRTRVTFDGELIVDTADEDEYVTRAPRAE
jgi:hypothetical protein